MAPSSRRSSAPARSRCASSGARRSIEKRTRPGITLIASGLAAMRPTVPASPASAAARRSTASTHSAAPASASRRASIGTVPAWPAAPRSSTSKREAPLIAVTQPDGEPLRLEHRPLLDMQLGISEDVVATARGAPDRGGIEAVSQQCLGHAGAAIVAPPEQRRVERAGKRLASRHRGAEAHALLVDEGDALDGERKAPALALHRLRRRRSMSRPRACRHICRRRARYRDASRA